MPNNKKNNLVRVACGQSKQQWPRPINKNNGLRIDLEEEFDLNQSILPGPIHLVRANPFCQNQSPCPEPIHSARTTRFCQNQSTSRNPPCPIQSILSRMHPRPPVMKKHPGRIPQPMHPPAHEAAPWAHSLETRPMNPMVVQSEASQTTMKKHLGRIPIPLKPANESQTTGHEEAPWLHFST